MVQQQQHIFLLKDLFVYLFYNLRTHLDKLETSVLVGNLTGSILVLLSILYKRRKDNAFIKYTAVQTQYICTHSQHISNLRFS